MGGFPFLYILLIVLLIESTDDGGKHIDQGMLPYFDFEFE